MCLNRKRWRGSPSREKHLGVVYIGHVEVYYKFDQTFSRDDLTKRK